MWPAPPVVWGLKKAHPTSCFPSGQYHGSEGSARNAGQGARRADNRELGTLAQAGGALSGAQRG